ncbi:hypothetical protein KAFR_0F01780 [Kazachstania africana CBS 2517]|uniref:Cytochrome b-c1 complex subunit 8 n=1 Tax=Kazachstania africana (strain ATCC 22294 / BCRC 22015 / CBS 2517 / CECT 1963 / NBRC 1671 / NRRL Y-8276) TaxID=1071382 RepID=H2AWM5_KAZAF|nr:hypothetical protein KAFR_0F01780 [Kazachstania africana CBS 2517]CCF58775.1 hypothetical protein KAFR_0F01780 [Kazachstania africana CBS 2517]
MGGPEARTYMGWWGHMGSPKQKGITSYAVSPYAQKPLANNLHNAFFNSFRRFKAQVLFVLVPAGLYWYWLKNSREYNAYLYTKAGKEELDRVNA